MDSNLTTIILMGAAILLGLLLLGGASDAPTTKPVDSAVAPVGQEFQATYMTPALRVDVGQDIHVTEREQVRLSPAIFGSTGGVASYRWSANGALGFFNDPTIKNPIYTSPSACDCEDCVILTLTVTDMYGVSASDSLLLTVRDPLACPPDSCVSAPVCAPVDLCVLPATETCPAPDVPCASPCITEVPPTDPCGEIMTPCSCVADECASTWMPSWPFGPEFGPPGDRPSPRIIRRFPSHIPEGSSFVVRGTISNSSCVSGCFVWTASKGTLEGADTLSPTYHAPQSDRPTGERVTISLTLYDGLGGRSYDQVRLTIDNTDYAGPAVP